MVTEHITGLEVGFPKSVQARVKGRGVFWLLRTLRATVPSTVVTVVRWNPRKKNRHDDVSKNIFFANETYVRRLRIWRRVRTTYVLHTYVRTTKDDKNDGEDDERRNEQRGRSIRSNASRHSSSPSSFSRCAAPITPLEHECDGAGVPFKCTTAVRSSHCLHFRSEGRLPPDVILVIRLPSMPVMCQN